MKNKRFISNIPRISIRNVNQYSIVDLDMITSDYNINEEGAKVISEYLKDKKPYLGKNSKRYLKYIPRGSMYVQILNEKAEEFAIFLLNITTDKKYIS